MKFLITGGAGMIGFHTAIKLKEMGHDVRCIDNFNDIIYDSKIKYDRVKILKLSIKTSQIYLSIRMILLYI